MHHCDLFPETEIYKRHGNILTVLLIKTCLILYNFYSINNVLTWWLAGLWSRTSQMHGAPPAWYPMATSLLLPVLGMLGKRGNQLWPGVACLPQALGVAHLPPLRSLSQGHDPGPSQFLRSWSDTLVPYVNAGDVLNPPPPPKGWGGGGG